MCLWFDCLTMSMLYVEKQRVALFAVKNNARNDGCRETGSMVLQLTHIKYEQRPFRLTLLYSLVTFFRLIGWEPSTISIDRWESLTTQNEQIEFLGTLLESLEVLPNALIERN